MDEGKNPFRNIKVILRPSTPKLRLAVILLIVFSMAALITLGVVHRNIRSGTQTILGEAAALEEENADLQNRIDNIDSSQVIAQIAGEELGLVDPDTVIIQPDSE